MPFFDLYMRASWVSFGFFILLTVGQYFVLGPNSPTLVWLIQTYPWGSFVSFLMLLLILTFVLMALWSRQSALLKVLGASILGTGATVILITFLIGIFVIWAIISPP